MTRRTIVLLCVAFVITRGLSGFLAHNPDAYSGDTNVAGDTLWYHFYAQQTLDADRAPYDDVGIEYPPGSLPFISIPYFFGQDETSYRAAYIALAIAIDALGLLALVLLARRWGSAWGPWLWVGVMPLLGPVAHVRLDLIPAVATLWAFERAAARRWFESGAAIGLGAAAKLYPIVLLPLIAFAAPRRRGPVVAAAIVGAFALIPYLGEFGGLYDSVVGYHSDRGVQVESTWGVLLLLAGNFGYDAVAEFNFGAFHVTSSASTFFDTLAMGLTFAAVAAALALGTRPQKSDAHTIVTLSFALLAILVPVSAVWSPQYLVWIAAPAAAMLCRRVPFERPIAGVLAFAAVASQIAYPFVYDEVLTGGVLVGGLLLLRNLAVLGVGLAVGKRLLDRADDEQRPEAAPADVPV